MWSQCYIKCSCLGLLLVPYPTFPPSLNTNRFGSFLRNPANSQTNSNKNMTSLAEYLICPYCRVSTITAVCFSLQVIFLTDPGYKSLILKVEEYYSLPCFKEQYPAAPGPPVSNVCQSDGTENPLHCDTADNGGSKYF